MTSYSRAPQSFPVVVDSINFPKFVSDLLKAVFAANLDVQKMDQVGGQLMAVGFAVVAQVPLQRGDVAVSAKGIGIYDGRAWAGLGGGLHPPYRVYRRR